MEKYDRIIYNLLEKILNYMHAISNFMPGYNSVGVIFIFLSKVKAHIEAVSHSDTQYSIILWGIVGVISHHS
jgi:hypothetical protein